MAKASDVKIIVRAIRPSSSDEMPGDPKTAVVSGVTLESYLKSFFDRGYDLKDVFHLGVQQPEGFLQIGFVLVKYE